MTDLLISAVSLVMLAAVAGILFGLSRLIDRIIGRYSKEH